MRTVIERFTARVGRSSSSRPATDIGGLDVAGSADGIDGETEPDQRTTEPPKSVVQTLRSLWPLISEHRWGLPTIVCLGVLGSLAEGVGLSLFVPLFEGLDAEGDGASDAWWIEALRAPFDGLERDDRVLVIGGCIFGAIAVRAALGYANTLVFAWLDARISHRLRSSIFGQLLDVNYRFIERASFGKLLNTLATETWRTSDALALGVRLIITILNVVVYVGLLLLLSVQLTVFVGLAMVTIALLVRFLTRQVGALGVQANVANQRLSTRMVEGLTLMEVIRTFGRERYEHQRFDEQSQEVSAVSLRLARLGGAIPSVYQVLSGVLLVGVAVVTLRGSGDVASLLVFIFVLYRLQPQVTALDGTTTQLRSLSAAVDDVTSLLAKTAPIEDVEARTPHGRLVDGLVARDVTFRYEDEEAPALDGVNLLVEAGKVTALVGPSGAGKSTLIKMLFRFYEPDSGQILVDGQPLTELDLATWRRGIALVSQDVQLFDASVADNIGYGRPDATRDEIRDAAMRADAHEFIEDLPQGYDTRVGDRGVRLSGGQKQRVTLARAIVRDPELLILDEATNALDSRSERVIQDALDELSENRTVIVIAHRFSTIQRADHVIVLDDGRVSESGDRDTLLRNDGLFKRLTELQESVGNGEAT